MDQGLANRILVWSLSDTDTYTLENCDWCTADSIGEFHFLARQFIEDELALLYGEFSEWFNLAEFPDVGGKLEQSEVTVFLEAAGAPTGVNLGSAENYDCFSGLCAVIRHRLSERSLEKIKLAAELFNWTIDYGLSFGDTNAQAVLRVGSVEEVAPFLLERILNRLARETKQMRPPYQAPQGDFIQRFVALAPMVEMLKETAESAGWVQNQLAVKIFIWIADTYKLALENE
jgi:hypothetical protein